MRIVIFGATGMVGQGALKACLAAPDVKTVLSVARRPSPVAHAKLRQLLRAEMVDFSDAEDDLTGVDACIWCVGVSSLGMNEADYTLITHDLTLAAATTLARLNPGMRMVFVSAEGADPDETGRVMWRRVKGRTEKDLRRLPFGAVHAFRPGAIQPLDGIVSRTPAYRLLYGVLQPVLGLARRLAPERILTTDVLGNALLEAARGHTTLPVLETRDINKLGTAGHHHG